MKNSRYILLLFSTIVLLLFPKTAHAEVTSLTISPAVIRIEAKPPADVWTPFTIENTGNQPISLKIGYKPFDPQASSNGNVIFLSDGQTIPGADKKIFDKMQIVDDKNISHDTIDIGPKQKLRFRLRIILPINELQSDYYFSLLFLQSSRQIDQISSKDNVKNHKSSSAIQAGIGINVLLSVGDKEAPVASIDTFKTPLFLNSGPALFDLSIRNSGSHFLNPHGAIQIKNMFGQTVGKISVPSLIILAGTSRNISGNRDIQNASITIPSFGGNGLVWSEDFLLGIYTATLTIALSDNGPVYIRTIHFIAFPAISFVEILIVLVIILSIYLRVKRKLS